jgi:peptidoglycan/LPS O-acetylase OafA/YrhL
MDFMHPSPCDGRAAGQLGRSMGPYSQTVRHYPNFDFLRLLAAVSVIFSHAFLIAEGTQQNEWLVRLSGNQCGFGLLGVFVFFTISGFLVTQSFVTSRAPGRFAAARALRIFPGLAICLLVCTLVIGPAVSTLPLADYLRHPRAWRFFVENLLLQPSDETLPGVLFADNPAGVVVNGTMWTLRYEVQCYAMVLLLGVIGRLNLSVALTILVASFACNVFDLDDVLGDAVSGGAARLGGAGKIINYAFDLGGFLWLLPFFAAGMCLYFMSQRTRLRGALALVALLGIAATLQWGGLILAFPLLGGYVVIYVATSLRLHLPRAARFGDFSYGLYVYGWPPQQLVAYWTSGTAPWSVVFASGLALALGAAFISWHLIEKPSLASKVTAALRPQPQRPTLI